MGSERDLALLPKAELHLHLEGAMRPSTLTELCAKHGVVRPADTRGQRFPDFGPFAACYIAVCECLREEADIFRLVREVAEDAAASGALWIEPALSASLYSDRFGGMEATLRLLLRAAAAAEEATGVGMAFVVAIERGLPGKSLGDIVAEAEALADTVLGLVEGGAAQVQGHAGIAGLGLHGPEPGHPPGPFAAVFERVAGRIKAVPHAGELAPVPGGGPESVRVCVDQLSAKRVAHGVLAIEDPELVKRLAADGICLDVCPTSNYLLRVVGELAEHPLPQLLRAGVACTLNSDDPLLFGASLLEEFHCARADLGLADSELAECAKNSFLHSSAPDEVRKKGLAGIEAWLAGMPNKAPM